jgi:hypothetical protein
MATAAMPPRRQHHVADVTPDSLGPMSFDDIALLDMPALHWDLRGSCTSVLPALGYVSRKLAHKGIHVALIMTSSTPELIPIWPIHPQSQAALYRIIQRAARKNIFNLQWLDAWTALCQEAEPDLVFALHRSMSYLVHRSLVQHDVIFGGEGLTLLAADCVFTFKTLVRSLAQHGGNTPAYRICRDSCAQLLHRVNSVYTGTKLSVGYLRRAYGHLEIRQHMLDDVCGAYEARYHKPALADRAGRSGFGYRATATPDAFRSHTPAPASARPAAGPAVGDLALRPVHKRGPHGPVSPKDLPRIVTSNLVASLPAAALPSARKETSLARGEDVEKLRGGHGGREAQSARPLSPKRRFFDFILPEPAKSHRRASSAHAAIDRRVQAPSPIPEEGISPLGIYSADKHTPLTAIPSIFSLASPLAATPPSHVPSATNTPAAAAGRPTSSLRPSSRGPSRSETPTSIQHATGIDAVPRSDSRNASRFQSPAGSVTSQASSSKAITPRFSNGVLKRLVGLPATPFDTPADGSTSGASADCQRCSRCRASSRSRSRPAANSPPAVRFQMNEGGSNGFAWDKVAVKSSPPGKIPTIVESSLFD